MSILPQPVHPTGNVLIEEEPVLEPATRRTIITLHCAIGGCGAAHANEAARTFADLRSDSLGAGWHPGDVCPDPAHENLRHCYAVLGPEPAPVPEDEVPALARPYITVATVPASPQTLEAAETVQAAADRSAQEAGEDAEPGPATQVMDAASMHTQTMTAITPAVGGEGGAA